MNSERRNREGVGEIQLPTPKLQASMPLQDIATCFIIVNYKTAVLDSMIPARHIVCFSYCT